MKLYKKLILASCAVMALAGCGADDIASPGSGGNVTINNNGGTGGTGTTPTTPSGGLVVAATGCPTIADPQGLKDDGTITGPSGTWRVCTLPSRINRSITLSKLPGVLYQMAGRVDVGTDNGFNRQAGETQVVLTIAPGVIVYGGTGVSWLAVNRGNQINAVGTAAQPVIFTSRENVLGTATDTSQGQWGGVVLMGRARITDCSSGSTASNTCERQTEGAADPARYGGTDDTDNSGRMSYVQIRYSGFVLGSNSELQALTTEGVGSGTQLDHIMTFNSSDDGAEIFGGVVNLKHYIAVGSDDDSLDVDVGAQANFQYGLLIQRPGFGDAFMEIDSNGFETDTPRTNLKVANFTAVQPNVSPSNESNNQASLMYRGNSDVTLVNSVIVSPNNECLRQNGSGTTPTTLTARSVVMSCNAAKYLGTGSINVAAVTAAFGAGANGNSDSFVSTLTSGFINGANELAVAPFNVSGLGSFFTPTAYVGAVRDANDNWWAGWACNSSTANFGSTSGACTALPTN